MPGRVNRVESAVTIGAVVYDDFGALSHRPRSGSPALESQGLGGASDGDCGAGTRGRIALIQPWAMGGLESCVPASHASHFALSKDVNDRARGNEESIQPDCNGDGGHC